MAVYLLISGPETILPGDFTPPAGVACNRIEWDGIAEWTPPFGCTAIPDDGRALWTPPVPVPTSVSRWQLQYVMAETPSKKGGTTVLADANALAAQIGGGAEIAWLNAPSLDRTSPLLNQLAPQIGLSEADMDAMFIAAAQVTL